MIGEAVAGLVAFGVFFTMWIVLPSIVDKRRNGKDEAVARMAVAFRQGLLNTDFSAAGEQGPGYEEVIDLFTAMLRGYIEVDPAGGDPAGGSQAAGKQMLKDFVEQLMDQYAVDTDQKPLAPDAGRAKGFLPQMNTDQRRWEERKSYPRPSARIRG